MRILLFRLRSPDPAANQKNAANPFKLALMQ
jgi:hypothetical protein